VVDTPLSVEVGETLPQGAAEQETVQVTPFPAVSFRTLAVNCAVVPDWTVTEMGETETEMGGAEDPPPQPELLAAINARNGIATSRVRLFEIMVDPLHSSWRTRSRATQAVRADNDSVLTADSTPRRNPPVASCRRHRNSHGRMNEHAFVRVPGLTTAAAST
jgi:hypothetical protein